MGNNGCNYKNFHSRLYGCSESNVCKTQLTISMHCPLVAPKVMPLIYFHANCNSYKEHNNNIWESKFSAKKDYFLTVTTIIYTFLSSVSKTLHAVFIKTVLPLLKWITHCLILLTSCVWFPLIFCKYQ